jgi:hypothetical protein
MNRTAPKNMETDKSSDQMELEVENEEISGARTKISRARKTKYERYKLFITCKDHVASGRCFFLNLALNLGLVPMRLSRS